MPNKLTIRDQQALAKSKGGNFLSKEYKGSHLNHLWECKLKHTWWATPSSVQSVSWCPKCAGVAKGSVEGCRALGKSRGGDCLSKEYKNAMTALLWECKEKYTWWATPNTVQQGSWCPHCAGVALKTILDYQNFGKKISWKFIGPLPKNIRTKTNWECSNGHDCQIALCNLLYQGHRCKQCKTPVQESRTKTAAEQLWNRQFEKAHPDWLMYKNGSRLELDGYNEELKIAFEYNGEQHYKKNIFSKTNNALQDIKERDSFKKAKCEEMGVRLFVIRHDRGDIETQFRTLAKAFGIPVSDKAVDFSRADCGKSKMDALRAKVPDWTFPDQPWAGVGSKVTCYCPKNHLVKMRPDELYRGRGCGQCYRETQLSEESVGRIKTMLASGVKGTEIAKIFNVAHATISLIKSGEHWGNIAPRPFLYFHHPKR